MRPLIYTTVFGQKWQYYGDRLINSIRTAGYLGDILVLCDGTYEPSGDARACYVDLNDIEVALDRDVVAAIWMSRYYIDQYAGGAYTDYLYLDADCVVVPGRTIDGTSELFAPGNWFTKDRTIWDRKNYRYRQYYAAAIPPEELDRHPEWHGINSGTFKVERQYLHEFCEGVRGVFKDHDDIIADQAALNGYLRMRAKLPWNVFREFLVAFINSFDYDSAFQMNALLIHELGSIKGDNYQCDVLPSL